MFCSACEEINGNIKALYRSYYTNLQNISGHFFLMNFEWEKQNQNKIGWKTKNNEWKTIFKKTPNTMQFSTKRIQQHNKNIISYT